MLVKRTGHHKYIISCDYRISEKCKEVWEGFLNYTKENSTKHKCKYCSEKNPSITRKYEINDNLFENIDTEEKAYILGFVAADGYLSPEGKVRITLKNIDYDILVKIKNYICPELPVHIKTTKLKRRTAALLIARQKIANDMAKHLKLEKLGAKTFTVKFPDLPTKELQLAFIRGYFDGDGGMTKNLKNRNHFCATIVSASKDILINLIGVYGSGVIEKHNSKPVWYVRYRSRKGMLFLYTLYSSSKIHLDRKYELYKDWKTLFNKPNKAGWYVGVKMFDNLEKEKELL